MRYHGSLYEVSENLAQITDALNSPWLILTGILTSLFTLAAVVVAIISMKEIRSLVFRAHIVPKELKLVKTNQQNKKGEKFIYHRLIVRNSKRLAWWPGSTAKGVRVLLTYYNNEQPFLEGFIPIPLRWTYWGKSYRDISRGEPAYLDIFCQGAEGKKYEFCWADDAQGSYGDLLNLLNPDFGDLRLEFFESTGGLLGDMRLRYFVEESCYKVISWK